MALSEVEGLSCKTPSESSIPSSSLCSEFVSSLCVTSIPTSLSSAAGFFLRENDKKDLEDLTGLVVTEDDAEELEEP